MIWRIIASASSSFPMFVLAGTIIHTFWVIDVAGSDISKLIQGVSNGCERIRDVYKEPVLMEYTFKTEVRQPNDPMLDGFCGVMSIKCIVDYPHQSLRGDRREKQLRDGEFIDTGFQTSVIMNQRDLITKTRRMEDSSDSLTWQLPFFNFTFKKNESPVDEIQRNVWFYFRLSEQPEYLSLFDMLYSANTDQWLPAYLQENNATFRELPEEEVEITIQHNLDRSFNESFVFSGTDVLYLLSHHCQFPDGRHCRWTWQYSADSPHLKKHFIGFSYEQGEVDGDGNETFYLRKTIFVSRFEPRPIPMDTLFGKSCPPNLTTFEEIK